MNSRTPEPGHSLPELLLVLTILGLLSAFALRGVGRGLDHISVRAAREAIAGAAAQARTLAVTRGRAFLEIDERGLVNVLGRDTLPAFSPLDLRERYGVTMSIENSVRTMARLEYDALGVGRLANLTVRVRRGQSEGAVTFSAYGRPRAW